MTSERFESYHIDLLNQHDELLCDYFGGDKEIKEIISTFHKDGVLDDKEFNRVIKRRNSYDMISALLPVIKRKQANTFLKFLLALQKKAESRCLFTVEDRMWTILKTLVIGLENHNLSDLKLPDKQEYADILQSLRDFVRKGDNPKTLISRSTPYKSQLCETECAEISKTNRLFYSPIHGVSVRFHSNVKEFKVQMSVCDPNNAKMPPDYELCSAIVWFDTDLSDVQFDHAEILLPHCASISCREDMESLTVFALQDDDCLNMLDFSTAEIVVADFSSCGYKAKFSVTHFTYYATGIDLSKRKRPRFEAYDDILRKQSINFLPPVKKSFSVEEEESRIFEADQGKTRSETWSGSPHEPMKRKVLVASKRTQTKTIQFQEFCLDNTGIRHEKMECTNSVFSQNIFQAEITCVLPKHRSESFQMLFVIRLPLPTIDYLLNEEVQKLFSKEHHEDLIFYTKPVFLTSQKVLFEVSQSIFNGWTVLPVTDNETPTVDVSTQDLHRYGKLPKMWFTALSDEATGELKCIVSITGALANEGKLYFSVSSTKKESDGKSGAPDILKLNIDRIIFKPNSSISDAIIYHFNQTESTSPKRDHIINITQEEDHKFIVCLSYKISRWKDLAGSLMLTRTDIECIQKDYKCGKTSEMAYQMLCQWATHQLSNSSVSTLCKSLHTCAIMIEVTDNIQRDCKIPYHIQAVELDDKFMLAISHEIKVVWKTIGRLLGHTWIDIQSLERDHYTDTSESIAYEMLLSWKKKKGKDATFGDFYVAVYLVSKLESTAVFGALRSVRSHLKLLQSKCNI